MDLRQPRPGRDRAWAIAMAVLVAAFLGLVLPDAADTEAVDIEGVSPVPPASRLVRAHTWSGLRALGGHPLDGLAAEAVALAGWHGAHQRCPRCGEPTTVEQAGWVRRCVAEDREIYPRTDPAVIMAVVDDDDRLLLGHAAHWPDGRFSTLAGYVEPGESLEQAVRREVAEETSVVVGDGPGDVEYRGSQPWPFPASLMLGFRARAIDTRVAVDGVEVTQARWFTRAEFAEAARTREIGLPGKPSIARALVEEWYGANLDELSG
jgi:NAD+ diphosphatase